MEGKMKNNIKIILNILLYFIILVLYYLILFQISINILKINITQFIISNINTFYLKINIS